MDNISLHKIIKSFVLPKYDWIEDYHINFYYDSPIEKYGIIYYVYPDKDGSFTVSEEMEEVESLTYSLFKMLGPSRYQMINEISFQVKSKYHYD